MRAACDAAGLALVPLIAPTTPDDRMAEIAAPARGFLYTVSVTGTTGERAGVDRSLAAVLARAKRALPGPGRRRLRHLHAPSRRPPRSRAGAEGVIVGSWLVRAAGEAADPGARRRRRRRGSRRWPRPCAR